MGWAERAQSEISDAESSIAEVQEALAQLKKAAEDAPSPKSQTDAEAERFEANAQSLWRAFPGLAREKFYTDTGLGSRLALSSLVGDEAKTDVCGTGLKSAGYVACNA